MSSILKVLANPRALYGSTVSDLSQLDHLIPPCNPKVLSIAQQAIQYTKDLFQRGLDAATQKQMRPYETSGKILYASHGQNCSTPETGSICYQVVLSKFQEKATASWKDFLHVQNWNATGNIFLYQAQVQSGDTICEKLFVGKKIYLECEGIARNGTICNLPLLRKLCEVPPTVSQTVKETINQTAKVVVETANEPNSITTIFKDYAAPLAPFVTGLASAYTTHKAVTLYQTEGITSKTCAFALTAIASIAATTLMI